MRSIIKWAILNSPAMNTFVIAMLAIGAVSMIVMRREVFPEFQLEIVLVSVPFPGATPEETEEGICQKVESAVSNIDGIKKISSVASESFGFVVLELHGYVDDVQKVINEVKQQVDTVNFPVTAEKPEIRQIVFRTPAISLGLTGPPRSDNPEIALRQEKQLRDLAEDIRDELIATRAVPPKSFFRRLFAGLFQPTGPAISSAEIVAAKPFEVAIEVSEDKLREYGLSLERVASLVRMQNVEVPGGKVQTAGEELLLRGKNKREVGPEIAEIPLLTRPNGDIITVGQIARVIDGFEDTPSEHIINGRPGLTIRVSKTGEEDLFTVVEAVRAYVAKRNLPEGYALETWGDVSLDVQDRVRLLTTNGIQGLVLVFVVLALFLELRLAFWVALGIPIAILGAGFVLLLFDQTLNMLTMFAFLMALGIVVDDAIVIGENIYEKRMLGLPPLRAAVDGTLEVFPSVAASVTTTVIAFVPLMYVSGVMGKFIAVMPVAIIAMLLISLVESILVLPSHLSHDNNLFMRIVSGSLYALRFMLTPIRWASRMATSLMEWFVDRIYMPVLGWSIDHKVITFSAAIGSLIVSIGIIAAGIVPFAAFPEMDSREISATVVFPNGTNAAFARREIERLEDTVREVCREYEASTGMKVLEQTYRRIGEIGDELRGPTGVTEGSHVATVEVQLVSPDERLVGSDEIIREWRNRVPKISGAEILKFGARSMGPGGAAIEFKLLAAQGDEEALPIATRKCKEYLASKVGVSDIEDDARPGKSEAVWKLNEVGQALGLDENQLASTLRAGYYGIEVMRMQRGRHEVKLMVRYPSETRKNIDDISRIMIRDNNGLERPVTEVADQEVQRAFATINRQNQRRCVGIVADVDVTKANASEIVTEMKATFIPELLKEMRDRYGADIAVDWEGQTADTADSFRSMGTGYAVALMAMFVLLTLEFKSYIQPFIIMAIIPFGIVGAILGHGILGLQLTLFSFFGLVALTGVIVNDSIVLIDFINHRVQERMTWREAVLSAGKRRFRPILLTTLTTVAGLFPMLFETSLQAQVLIPMATSLIFGLMTGTFLILVLVPVFFGMYSTLLQIFGVDMYEDDSELNEPRQNLSPVPSGQPVISIQDC